LQDARQGACTFVRRTTCEPAVNRNHFAFQSVSDDRLAINDATRHQYYSTMQAETGDDDLLLAALNRRKARALIARRDHRRLGIGLVVLAVCVVPALVWWLG
jgi:hypothetical protein